jgi:hypothetical protein
VIARTEVGSRQPPPALRRAQRVGR